MKKIFLLVMVTFSVTHFALAKIWRVNNNPGITADFTSAQAAHDAPGVIAGDTLYFEHSATNYGNLIMAKRLVLLGTGDFLNVSFGLQYNLNYSNLNILRIRPSAANSTVSISAYEIKDSADGVLITRCRIYTDISFYYTSNCTLSNSFVGGSVYAYMKPAAFSGFGYIGCTNLTIDNNIASTITQDVYYYQNTACSGCTPAYVVPHSLNVYNNSLINALIAAGSIYNNIALSIITDANTPVTNNITYNPLSASQRQVMVSNAPVFVPFEGGNNNQFTVASNTLFIGGANDTSYRLKPACAAIGSGTSGVDCGATGGSTPYIFGVQPAIPAIYKLSAAAASSGNTISVTVSTKSNN